MQVGVVGIQCDSNMFVSSSLLKQQYRSELGIVADILDVVMNSGRQGVIVSSLARMANLSHVSLLEKCQKLTNAGLMESMKDERKTIFKITEKGIKFFQEYARFQDAIKELKLRC